MSDFNRLFFEQSYNKSLKQADKIFWVGIVSGITGFLFFVAALSSISFANTKDNFANLNQNVKAASENMNKAIEKDEVIKSYKSELKSVENNEDISTINEEIRAKNKEIRARNKEIRDELVNLKNELEHLSLKFQRQFTTFNYKYLVIVSLLGGGFLELIAIVSFVQYSKINTKASDSSDKNQMFYLVNSIYEQFDDEHKKKVFPLIINKIFTEANNNEQSNPDAKDEGSKDSEQDKNGSQQTAEKKQQ